MVFKETNMPEQCPPSNAIQQDVECVYRFIENDTVQEIDFLNHKERNRTYPSDRECEAVALSFFTSTVAAEKSRKRFKSLKGKVLAEGKITSECGIHETKNHHLNLWLFENVNMMKTFTGEED
ncbi:hypothetical protein EXW32_29095 (plasmid) [Bacillus mycoides]|uniref:hypothetical protein n=1 Tax=Bacillus mycoides TaxID=1405 RepID=UPI001C02797C|nr:hypothetical protein [Bacillus mycoides]QWG70402.1 hypothetical protein EXW32_29095 [Bacillus mycoides]